MSKSSTGAGVLYTYTHPAPSEIHYRGNTRPRFAQDAWYVTALDLRSGRRLWSRLAGTGFGYNNNYAPVTLGPDGTAYVGVLGGLVAVRDTSAARRTPPRVAAAAVGRSSSGSLAATGSGPPVAAAVLVAAATVAAVLRRRLRQPG